MILAVYLCSIEPPKVSLVLCNLAFGVYAVKWMLFASHFTLQFFCLIEFPFFFSHLFFDSSFHSYISFAGSIWRNLELQWHCKTLPLIFTYMTCIFLYEDRYVALNIDLNYRVILPVDYMFNLCSFIYLSKPVLSFSWCFWDNAEEEDQLAP